MNVSAPLLALLYVHQEIFRGFFTMIALTSVVGFFILFIHENDWNIPFPEPVHRSYC